MRRKKQPRRPWPHRVVDAAGARRGFSSSSSRDAVAARSPRSRELSCSKPRCIASNSRASRTLFCSVCIPDAKSSPLSLARAAFPPEGSSRARRRPICRSSSRPHSSSWSIWRPPRRSALPCRNRCWSAPTRLSSKEGERPLWVGCRSLKGGHVEVR